LRYASARREAVGAGSGGLLGVLVTAVGLACSPPMMQVVSYDDHCSDLVASAVATPNVVPGTFRCLSDGMVQALIWSQQADSDQTFAELGQTEATLKACGPMTSLGNAMHDLAPVSGKKLDAKAYTLAYTSGGHALLVMVAIQGAQNDHDPRTGLVDGIVLRQDLQCKDEAAALSAGLKAVEGANGGGGKR